MEISSAWVVGKSVGYYPFFLCFRGVLALFVEFYLSLHSIPHRSGKRGQNTLDKIGQGGSLGEHRGSKVGGKPLDMSVQNLTALDKGKALDPLCWLTEGSSWWRWGRVELPVQTSLPENVLQA